jgi:hypothetical protein
MFTDVYVGSRSESPNKMAVCYEQFGGSFKCKWRLFFYILLNIFVITVSVRTETVDSGGYIVYCPCMGKIVIHTNVIMYIVKGYVVNSIIVYLHQDGLAIKPITSWVPLVFQRD